MLPLRPVAALAEHVQARVGDAVEQLEAPVDGHEAVVAAPGDQGLGLDVRQVGAEVAEVELAQLDALEEVLQVLRVGEDAVEAQLDQLFGQRAGVVDEDVEHLLQVVQGRLAVDLEQQLDAFHRQRREQAGLADATGAHEDQLAQALGELDGECQCAAAAHGVANQVRLVDVQRIHQALGVARIDHEARLGGEDRIGFAEARAVEQDHPVAGRDEGVDVAVKVGPAGGTGAGAVQHDHHLAFADVVVVQAQVADLGEVAGVVLGVLAHGLIPFVFGCQVKDDIASGATTIS
ncbi:hypothetical protein D3C86_1381830 [compost metagenome]